MPWTRRPYVRSLVIAGCVLSAVGLAPFAIAQRVVPSFSADRIRADVKHLSGDQFEGRGIGTLGEQRAIDFIAEEFAKAGLEPAGERGTFFQTVPLIGVGIGKATLGASKDDANIEFKLSEEFAGTSKTEAAVEDFDAEAVFVGHGITAPEFGWDDYQGIDVKGKVLIAFTNEPPSDDPKFFGGKALTYYGRWTYRFEEATRRGAKAMLIIHTNETAGYPYSVVQTLGGAQIQRKAGEPALAFAGWLSQKAGDRLLGLAGTTVEDALKAANTKGFRAKSLGMRMQGHIPTTLRRISTKNVLGIAAGSDPNLKAETVMFTAHWDHLGVRKLKSAGDNIYNGAADNATGCGILMEMARAWAKQQPRPKRSALFLATTAEESGLLGAVYYAQHPMVPLGKTAIDLNFDMLLPAGVPESVVVNGAERTTAWPIIQAAARKHGLTIEPDKRAHLGTFFRSDHFALARGGVPAFSVHSGDKIKGKPDDFVQKAVQNFIAKVYHTPADEFREDWDFAGFPVIMGFAFDIARDVANADRLPTWLPGDEFRAAREKSGVTMSAPKTGGKRPTPVRVVPQPYQTGRSVIIAPHGMVATSQPLAAQVGLDILRKGGNAVDAAIGVNAALGLMEPMSCGIGGDLFAIVWDAKTQKLYGLNASGRSPHKATRQFFADKGLKEIPLYGPLPWSVPGCVSGWEALHHKFGKQSLNDILAPTIAYAESGFPVSEKIAGSWQAAAKRLRKIPESAEVYLPGGKAPGPGEVFKNPALARAYGEIGAKGAAAFYQGRIAKEIVAYSERNGGLFTLKDFKDHTSTWVDPVSTTYRGYDVWELPPPGQGIAALQMLNILSAYDLKKMGPTSPDYWHLFVEAKKLAYADRARFYADPDFVKLPTAELISMPYADQRRKLIDMDKARTDHPAGDPKLGHADTVYLCVVDKDRNCVSFIQSNYHGFGSQHAPAALGFALQNRGNLFALDDKHLNRLEPHKRPFHTIIPAMVTRGGKPWLVFGVMGGDMQAQGHVQVLVNMIDFGMTVQEAGEAPRVEHVGSPTPTGKPGDPDGGIIHAERGLPDAVIAELMRRGHQLKGVPTNGGGYQAILIDPRTGMLHGGSEYRKDGCAVGY